MQNSDNKWPVIRAVFVHIYTASGAVLALFICREIAHNNPLSAVILSAIAMFIDGTDGILARKFDVKRWTPAFDGRKLDDIIDFLNYTFIPVFFLGQFNVVGDVWQYLLPLVLMASLYGFCQDGAKTGDGFFTGFPSYWNGVALYLYWLDWPHWAAGSVILLLIILTFLPTRYISMNQTVELRTVDRGLFAIWVVMLVVLLLQFEQPSRILLYGSLFYPIFYFAASFYLHRRAES